jgi:hypothetical protein
MHFVTDLKAVHIHSGIQQKDDYKYRIEPKIR